MGDNDATISDTGFGMDLGILIKPLPFLTLGFAVKELNAKYNWKTDKLWEKDIDKIDRFPRTFRGGLALCWPFEWLTLAIDLEKNNQQDLKYHLSTEVFLSKFIPQQIAIRCGLNNGCITAGAGYNFTLFKKQAQIHYAFVTKKYDVASEHIFSWVFNL